MYENGILKSVSTRENGEIGENITKNIKYVEGIPQKLSKLLNVQVDGEAYVPIDQFKKLNS